MPSPLITSHTRPLEVFPDHLQCLGYKSLISEIHNASEYGLSTMSGPCCSTFTWDHLDGTSISPPRLEMRTIILPLTQYPYFGICLLLNYLHVCQKDVQSTKFLVAVLGAKQARFVVASFNCPCSSISQRTSVEDWFHYRWNAMRRGQAATAAIQEDFPARGILV